MSVSRNPIYTSVTGLAMVLSLAACQSDNEVAGALLGGTTGAVIGNQFGKGDGNKAAIALGAIIGASVGQAIGASLDQTSRQRVGQSTREALATNQAITWDNPQNAGGAARGVTRITREGRQADGRLCREYLNTVVIGGQQEQAYGTACRNADGSWELIS